MPDRLIDSLPGLKKAACEIAYDNGMINRFCPESMFLDGVEKILLKGPALAILQLMDEYLDSLSEEDLITICAGEQTDRETIYGNMPLKYLGLKIGLESLSFQDALEEVLNSIFEGEYESIPDTNVYPDGDFSDE